MGWNHKGVAIELQGASFAAEIGGKRVTLSSLNAVKKAIDKHQTAKAQEVTLNVPVVARISKGRYYREQTEPDRIIHGVITRIDPVTLAVNPITAPDGWMVVSIYHDTPENVQRMERLLAAEAELKAAKDDAAGRVIGTSFGGRVKYGKLSNTYGEAVELFKKSCESAKKGESAD